MGTIEIRGKGLIKGSFNDQPWPQFVDRKGQM